MLGLTVCGVLLWVEKEGMKPFSSSELLRHKERMLSAGEGTSLLLLLPTLLPELGEELMSRSKNWWRVSSENLSGEPYLDTMESGRRKKDGT